MNPSTIGVVFITCILCTGAIACTRTNAPHFIHKKREITPSNTSVLMKFIVNDPLVVEVC